MKKALPVLLVVALMVVSLSAQGHMIKRQDAVWARTTSAPITLDGKLDEAAWATAEAVTVQNGVSAGMPGSGWVPENGKK